MSIVQNSHTDRRPYAPPAHPDDLAEGGDYDDWPSDMELDFNVDIPDKWPDAPEAA